MTAQASDVVMYRLREFSLAGISGKGLFDPLEHGFRPQSTVSFCWRGYICTYAVESDLLRLRELRVFFDSRVESSKPRVWEGIAPAVGKMGHFADYAPLDRPVPFSGGLLLGDDFIDELYVHMGFHPAWKYREVHELIFEDGKLKRAMDCSQAAAEFRKTISSEDLKPADLSRARQWVEQTFSLRYERG